MKRTTIITDDEILYRLKLIARREKKTVTEIINTVLGEYLVKEFEKIEPSFIGIGRSSRKDISASAEEILSEGIERGEGF